MPIYIIEHLEKEIYPWCLIEYKNISKIIGKNNLWFTNIKQKGKNLKELKKYGKILKNSVAKLNLKNYCILDPQARKSLNPKEAKTFDYFVFGGILGDYPPRKRTTPELTDKILKKAKKSEKNNIKIRNIGKKQFSTDNAVLVVKNIVKGINQRKMKFINNLTIKMNKIESIELPYCYPLIKGKPQISKELVKFLKKKKSF